MVIPEELLNIENRKKILVVDDEQDLRESLFTILAAQGHEVITATDGEEAIEKIKEVQPDLMMLDLMMPKMSGQEVLDKLQAENIAPTMKILILTALSDMESLSDVLMRGGLDYMVKSDWSLEDIVRKVGEKLAE